MVSQTIGYVRRAGAGAGWWLLVTLVFAVEDWTTRTATGQEVDVVRLGKAHLFAYLPWIVLSPAVADLVRRFPLADARRARHLAIHAGAALACGAVHTAMGVSLEALVAPGPPWLARYAEMLPRLFSGHIVVYGTLVAVLHAVAYRRALRERELQASRLEAQLAQAQLAVLRTQLQPHFLFNTLHAASALMARDVTAARRVLSRLSDLLRQSLDVDAEPEVSLREELDLLDRYLEIQRTRFGDRLEVALDVEPEAMAVPVPRLLLQPLVENAVRHGISPRAEGGRVEVRAARRGAQLALEVLDDGVGLPAGHDTPPREGVGLRLTRARLRALHGEAQAFEVRPREGGGVSVSISLPWRAAQARRAA